MIAAEPERPGRVGKKMLANTFTKNGFARDVNPGCSLGLLAAIDYTPKGGLRGSFGDSTLNPEFPGRWYSSHGARDRTSETVYSGIIRERD